MDLPADFWDAERAELYAITSALVLNAYQLGGMAGAQLLPPVAQVLIGWDVFNQSAIDYLTAYRMAEVAQITETTRQATIRAIEEWIRGGRRLDVLVDQLAPFFGNERARRIAVTEVTRAYAAGNVEAWKQSGYVSKKRWMTARDELVCPFCGRLDGQIVGIDDVFMIPIQSLPDNLRRRNVELTYMHPPAHVNCRCWLQPVVDEDMAGKVMRRILNDPANQ